MKLTRVAGVAATIIAVGMSVVHLKQPVAPMSTWPLMAIHVALGMAIGFLTYPATKGRKINISNLLLAALGICLGAYIVMCNEDIAYRQGDLIMTDIVLGCIAVILVLEFARRAVGLPMVIVAIAFLLYAFLGQYAPGAFGHRGFSIERVVGFLYCTTEGIYGIPIMVSATFVILFIIFSSFLQVTKTGDFFMGMANSLVGRARGGPAKIAVLSSALFGSISGSSIANVSATGSYTIPMMKKTGFKPSVAGAVEAVASSGGQIMPPIMGAGAFIMAEMTGIPYITICLAALLPAILYFFTIQVTVHLEAVKGGLRGLSKEEVPSFRRVFVEGGHLIIPLLVLLFLLIVLRMSPMYAAFWSIIAAVASSFLRKRTRTSLKNISKALEMGAKGSLTVVAACACAGIIIGIVLLTGLGLKFTGFILDAGGGSLLLTLFLTMVTCYILGMGVPTTAAYIMVAVVAVPVLINFGLPPLASHLFVFYSALLSDITPPVALASYAAAGIAGSDPTKTAVESVKLGWMKFALPFSFAYLPPLLILGYGPLEILWVFSSISLAIICLSAILENWLIRRLSVWEHLLLLGAATGFITGLLQTAFFASLVTQVAAIVLAAVVYLNQVGLLRKALKLEKGG